jgi:hypothetical protein
VLRRWQTNTPRIALLASGFDFLENLGLIESLQRQEIFKFNSEVTSVFASAKFFCLIYVIVYFVPELSWFNKAKAYVRDYYPALVTALPFPVILWVIYKGRTGPSGPVWDLINPDHVAIPWRWLGWIVTLLMWTFVMRSYWFIPGTRWFPPAAGNGQVVWAGWPQKLSKPLVQLYNLLVTRIGQVLRTIIVPIAPTTTTSSSQRPIWKMMQPVLNVKIAQRFATATAVKPTRSMWSSTVKSWAWVTSLPLICIVLRYFERISVSDMAFVGVLSLVSLFTVSISLWAVTLKKNEPLWVKLLPLLPFIVFVAAFFSSLPLEAGKQVWNARVALGQENMPASKWMDCKGDEPVPHLDVNEPEPIVIISVSGGGTRAAIFASCVFERMWWQLERKDDDLKLENKPVDRLPWIEDEGNTYPGRLLLRNVRFLSGLSGGALSTSYFQSRLYQELKSIEKAGKHGNLDSLQWRLDALKQVFNPPCTEPQNAPASTAKTATASQLQLCFPVYDNEAHKGTCLADILEPLPLVQPMTKDFIGATVAGFLQPWVGRGPAIQEYWREHLGWGTKVHPLYISDFAQNEIDGKMPFLIINSGIAETGSRLVISNLAECNFGPIGKLGAPVDQLEMRAQPHGQRYDPLPGRVNTLNQLDPYWKVDLPLAVRMSANVPVAYPAVRFYQRDGKSDDRLPVRDIAPNEPIIGDRILSAYDGGLVENSGLDSVMALLRKNAECLKGRKVLIFHINSDGVESDPRGPDFYGALPDLSEALAYVNRSNSNYRPTALSLYLSELRSLYGEDVAPEPISFIPKKTGAAPANSNQAAKSPAKLPVVEKEDPCSKKPVPCAEKPTVPEVLGFEGQSWAYYEVRLERAEAERVLTTWRLNTEDRRRLYEMASRPETGQAILKAAKWLTKERTPASPRLEAMAIVKLLLDWY